MLILKNKDYFPYALGNYFSNNKRWQTRAINSPLYQDLEKAEKQHKEELLKLVPDTMKAEASAILEKMDEVLASFYGISIDEAAIEGFRAGLELGELLYSGKSFESLLRENAFIEVEEKEAS